MTSSSHPPELDRYLARHGFAPHPGNSTWLDRDTGQQIIRIVREPGEETLLICLSPRSVCLHEAMFSPGTPDAVIIAALETALKVKETTGILAEGISPADLLHGPIAAVYAAAAVLPSRAGRTCS